MRFGRVRHIIFLGATRRARMSTTRASCIVPLALMCSTAFAQKEQPAIVTEAGEEIGNSAKKGVVKKELGSTWQRFADDAQEIYVVRNYKGVVPNVRDEPKIGGKFGQPGEGTPPVVQWVGFQPFRTYSRVFVRVGGNFEFSVTKERSDLIVVSIDNARVETPNDARFLVTEAFPTFVRKVTVDEEEGQGVRVSVYLKKPVGFLYRREGSYIFLDVEYHEE